MLFLYAVYKKADQKNQRIAVLVFLLVVATLLSLYKFVWEPHQDVLAYIGALEKFSSNDYAILSKFTCAFAEAGWDDAPRYRDGTVTSYFDPAYRDVRRDELRRYALYDSPLWSWELARQCCDVYPAGGALSTPQGDVHYIRDRRLRNGSIVYVHMEHVPEFLDRFRQLPAGSRVVLVTGMSDSGPLEIFSPKSRSAARPGMALLDFLRDDRLVAWFSQNYDVGHNPLLNVSREDFLIDAGSGSGSGARSSRQKRLLARENQRSLRLMQEKILPLPLGIDLHTFAGASDIASERFKSSVCKQEKLLHYMAATGVPVRKRPLQVLLSFACSYSKNDLRSVSRKSLCDLLQQRREGQQSVAHIENKGELGRALFWDNLRRVSFAIAPWGRGLDSNRVYETILLGAIPIVMTSPLDRLYAELPVLVLDRWEQIFNTSFLAEQKVAIVERFGVGDRLQLGGAAAPVDRLLSTHYWVQRIRSSIYGEVGGRL